MLLLALGFAVTLAVAYQLGYVALPLVMVYALMSAVTFIIFGLDKQAAINGRRRIPEARLYLFSLLGGWPGALVAQQLFRHKRRKRSFQRGFWLASGVNITIMLVWHAL